MKKTLLALALIGASSTAMADSWLYAGAAIGQSDFNGKNDTAMGVHVGTGILPIIGVEAGYWKLGSFSGNDVSTFYAAIKPSIDFGPLHIYARGGVHNYTVDQKGGGDDSAAQLMYGVGAEYFVFDMLSVGGGFQSFTDVKINGVKKDINTFTVNTTFHFL